MRHLVLITDAWHPQVNGVVTTLTMTVKLMEQRGWKVTVIHPRMFKYCAMPGYPQLDLTLNPWYVRKLLLFLKPTHVHIAVEGPLGIFARLMLSKAKMSYTTAYHTNFPQYLKIKLGIPESLTNKVIKWFHSQSSIVLTPSETTAMRLNKLGLKTRVWERGFDRNIFTYKPKQPADYLRLLYVGRVSHEKNIEDFLKLAGPKRKLTVVGDGPQRRQLENSYPDVSFVGFKSGVELASYYQEADVFVFPSKTDTLGVVMIEAIACGTPVAAYRVEGPQDVVSGGINGVLHGTDLNAAVILAAGLDSEVVHASSSKFSWERAVDVFEKSIVPVTG